MTDRTNFLTVVLEESMRTDDVEAIVAAISQIRGVASVGINVANGSEFATRMQVKAELTKKLYEALR